MHVPLRHSGRGGRRALTPEVAAEVQSFFRRCIEDLAGRVGGLGATARAHQIIATLEGGMILARAYGDIGAFDQATSALSLSSNRTDILNA